MPRVATVSKPVISKPAPLLASVREPLTPPRVADAEAGYRDAMSRAVTGVSIVTTAGPGGRRGLTVSAVTSVSVEPPHLLVCINRKSPLAAAIVTNGVFAVNLLSIEQRELAELFAGHGTGGRAYDFARAAWGQADTGAPLLEGAVASFDCRLTIHFDTATHRVCVGAVAQCRMSDADPLAYVRRGYGNAIPLTSLSKGRARS